MLRPRCMLVKSERVAPFRSIVLRGSERPCYPCRVPSPVTNGVGASNHTHAGRVERTRGVFLRFTAPPKRRGTPS